MDATAARRIAARFAIAFLLAAAPVAAGAATDYPTRPVRIIVPYGAGGIADVTMRLTARKMSESLGQQFIIDNRPGGGGAGAMKAVASSAPDGYTLSMIGGGLTIAKSLFLHLPYDLEKDFVPISTTAAYGLMVATKAGSPLRSVKDIIAAARQNPAKLNFGSINPGSAQNLSAELFRTLANIDVTMVPYKTTPELLTGLLRGDVDVAFEYDAGLRPAIDDHTVQVIAFTGPTRAPHIPDVPTVTESGIPGYDVTSWNGLAAPAGTPAEIVTLLNKAVNDAVSAPDVKAAVAQFGMEARGSSTADLQQRIKADVAKWAAVIDKAGIEKK
ncbi:MAG TPA: tripartite tricarboxylate transporter substrate-binding protein [Xanthobacteraceae bacterium]